MLVTFNQADFWVAAKQFGLPEKVSALKTTEFFRERAELADEERASRILKKVANRPVEKEDQMAVLKEPRATYRVSRDTAAKKAVKRRKRTSP